VKKALGAVAVIIAVMWVVKNPHGAAALVHEVVGALSTLASSLSSSPAPNPGSTP
jgi:hypothetical protein